MLPVSNPNDGQLVSISGGPKTRDEKQRPPEERLTTLYFSICCAAILDR